MIYNFEELTFQFLNIAKYKHRNGEFFVKPRGYAALSYRLSGEGRFFVDGKNMTVKKGDIVFIPSDMPYKVEYLCSESIVIHLLDCNYREAEKISVKDAGMIESRFQKLLDCRGEGCSINRIKACIYDILAHMDEERDDTADDPDVVLCMQYLREHFAESDMTVESLCRDGHISHSTLQRRFKKFLGVTPKQYLTRLRLNKAIDMLSRGDASVREIAYACGYDDEKYFSRVFKQNFGCPPMQFNIELRV